jgi:anti-sigma B factor antagonist
MLGFHVRIDRDGDAWSVACGGELDIATAPQVDDAVDLCFASRPTSLFVDCRDVTFIDSSGLSALLRIARISHDERVPFNLIVSDQVRSALTTAGLLERLLLGTTAAGSV